MKPAGINQGMLGDCWFLAACASLAEYPERIKRIFSNTHYSDVGIFKLNFWLDDKQVPIVVDDRLPIGLSRRSKNGAWWGPIIEKAYAKFSVNYANLNAGMP